MRRISFNAARCAALSALVLFQGGTALANTVLQTANPLPQGLQQGGFEQPDLALPSFHYASTLPPGSAWTVEVDAGLATVGSAIKLDGGGLDPLGAADGDQVGFIQNTTHSRIRQSVNLTAGSHRLTLKSAQRPGNNQTLKAQLDGADVLTLNPAGSTAWQTFTADFSTSGGAHVLSFHGLNTAAHTAFIDAVQLQSLGLLADGGFELPALAAATYANGSVPGSPWSGGGTGIAANGSAVTAVPAPQGQQAGFVQGGSTLLQAFTVTQAGRYGLSLKAAQRPGNQQSLKVLLDDIEVGLVKPQDENYSTFIFDGLKLTAGNHTLTFVGQDTVVGYIAMIDDVRLTSLAGRARNWSDAATWAPGYVPQPGDSVTIPAGAVVVLDSNTSIGSLVIEEGGELHCADQNLSVDAQDVHVEGRLVCGSPYSPYEHQFTLTLHGSRPLVPDPPDSMGRKFLAAMAPGVIELHGQVRKSWTQLAANAAIGTSSITLAEAVDWQPGDKIVIAPTRADPHEGEVVTISSVTGTLVSFTPALAHAHFGQSTVYSHGGSSWTLDERAEVGLLSRNIRIQGDSNSIDDRFGGHMMTMKGSVIHASGIELYRMGQGSLLARYPFHWHKAGDVKGQYIRNSSVHASFNRCITVHRSNYAEVSDNVCYDFIGHGYFLEDGNEEYNTFDGNLGIRARKPQKGQEVLPTDLRVGVASNGPATFWLSNPTNTVINNVAAGTEGSGFWYHTEDHVNGTPYIAPGKYNPKTRAFGVFDNNRMHTGVQGFSSCELAGGLLGMEAPGTEITNFSASNVDQALWPCANNLESMNATFEHVIVANTPSGMVSPSPVTMRDSLFVAYTDNDNQHPVLSTEHIGAAIWLYDQGVLLDGVRFINYDKAQTSVFGSFGGAHKFVSNRATGLSFVNSPNIHKDIMDATGPGSSFVSWGDVVHDLDGSLVGAGKAMVSDHPLMWDHSCTRPADKGIFGYACPHRYSRFMMTNDKLSPNISMTVQRSDGATGSGATALPWRAVNEYIANAGYIHSYRYNQGLDRHYLVVEVANGMDGDTDVHEILDVPANVLLWGGEDWAEVSSMSSLLSGPGRRYFHDTASSSLFLKTQARGDAWFATDVMYLCFTAIVAGQCQSYEDYQGSYVLNPPAVTITSAATAMPGAVTLTATATQSGGGSITPTIFVRDAAGTTYSGPAPLYIASLSAGSYAVKAVAVSGGQSYTALQQLVVGEPVRRVEITSLQHDGTYTAGAVPNLQIALYGTDATPHQVHWWLNGEDKGQITGTSVAMSGFKPGRNDIEVAIVNNADNSARPARDRRTIWLVSNGELAEFEDGIDQRMLLLPAGLGGRRELPRFAWGFRYSSFGANDNGQDDTNLFVVPYVTGLITPARYTLTLAPAQNWNAYQSISILHSGPAFQVSLVDSGGTRTLVGSAAAGVGTVAWNLPSPRSAVAQLEFVQAQATSACSYEKEDGACWQYLFNIRLSPNPAL
jgi:cell surface hyaluronidase